MSEAQAVLNFVMLFLVSISARVALGVYRSAASVALAALQ